jgi:uncharacterized membrane protein
VDASAGTPSGGESTSRGTYRLGADVYLAGLVLLAGTIVMLWYAPGAYQIYLAVHVLATVIWVGGDITLTTLGIVFERRQDGPTLAALGRLGTWIGTRVYTPALFVVFGFGVALVQKANLDWSTFWVAFGVGGWVVAATVGIGFVGPELGRIDKAAQEFGPESEEVQRRVRRLFAVFRFDTALLTLIVVAMTAKPDF